MEYLELDGDYLEGGGQILRTALSLSIITAKPIRVCNIRRKRPQGPGLKPQHLKVIQVLRDLSAAKVSGLELGSPEISFAPFSGKKLIRDFHLEEINIGTAGAIGLLIQSLLLAVTFKGDAVTVNIIGGTCGLGAIPVDYYPNVVFPILKKSGVSAELNILRRGYYPKGGGEVSLKIEPIKYRRPINLKEQGNIRRISGISIASLDLHRKEVAQRQAKEAERLLAQDFSCPVQVKAEYADTYSPSSEINLYAYTDSGSILGADARGELKKRAEAVGFEAYMKLKKEITSTAACDLHLADNLIPWLALLGGAIKTSEISKHTQTNIWVCEQFFGKIFKVTDNTVEVEKCYDT